MFFTPFRTFRTFPHFAKRRAAPYPATNASAKAMPQQKTRQLRCHGFCRGIAFAKSGLLCWASPSHSCEGTGFALNRACFLFFEKAIGFPKNFLIGLHA